MSPASYLTAPPRGVHVKLASSASFTGVDAGSWAAENAGLFGELGAETAAERIELWRAVAAEATGLEDVELAGPFQRHFTARGTGVPSNLCLVLTTDEVHAHKFDPKHIHHPLYVGADQISKSAASWPRGSVRATAIEPGRMAWGVTFEVDGSKPIPCRTPKLAGNPAAAIVIAALGGALPAP